MRIGLVGYHCYSGLGEKNRTYSQYLPIDRWLIKPHPHYGIAVEHPPCDVIVCREGQTHKLHYFLSQIDVLLYDESPLFHELLPMAKALGKRIVCVMAQEWMPFNNESLVDLFICPTKHAYEQFKDSLPCRYFQWPVDTSHFKFQHRDKCERFLFINGHGGWKGRKGGNTVFEMINKWKDIPLTIITQKEVSLNIESYPGLRIVTNVGDNRVLYRYGDVLLYPAYCDGTGLQPLEAMASGMPVICTEGSPWDENMALERIPSENREKFIRRVVDWFVPDTDEAIRLCKKWLGQEIWAQSNSVRVYAENRSWNLAKESLTALIKEGKPE